MKIVFIVPYYGEFPNYFNLFLKTCANNPEFDWLIVSDIKSHYEYPQNVHYMEMTWEQLYALIQSKFDFSISLETPYKLCDFKPAYGYIFQDYIKKYDYWGYCDVDLLFGKLKTFLPFEKIKTYDKVGHLGHMTLYRNTDEINRLFMKEINGNLRYKEVFTSRQNHIFDEWNWISINHIFLENKKKVWMFNDFFDIYPNDDNFRKVVRQIPQNRESYGKDMIEKKPSFASVEKGKIFQWSMHKGMWRKQETAYVHFQKRNMQVLVDETIEKFLCVPNQFIPMNEDSVPKKYIWKANIHRLLNEKKLQWEVKKAVFWIIVKTSLIRHPFRNNRRKQ